MGSNFDGRQWISSLNNGPKIPKFKKSTILLWARFHLIHLTKAVGTTTSTENEENLYYMLFTNQKNKFIMRHQIHAKLYQKLVQIQ